MRDLSSLASNSLATNSMHAGNQVWGQGNSMTAPGGESGDTAGIERPEPKIVEQPQRDVGTDAARTPKSYSPTSPTWKAAGNG